MFVADHRSVDYLRNPAKSIPRRRIWRPFRVVILARQGGREARTPAAATWGR
jgi:hypothetical protein